MINLVNFKIECIILLLIPFNSVIAIYFHWNIFQIDLRVDHHLQQIWHLNW